jgi:acyl-coenzyme A synthetase/AMP-(fatty) acid ligase/thioesterase domain-containing protein/acyl carrier protein
LHNLEWLGTSSRPLDWNGPRDRPFVEFRPDALDRPIIENLQHVVRRHADRVAISDSDSSIFFGDLWEGICRLGQIVAAQTAPGELTAILLPACSLSPLAMLACLAAGRPFAVVDIGQPGDWVVQTLESTRPALIIGSGEGRDLARIGATAAPFVDATRLPLSAPGSWRPADLSPDAPACVLLTSGSTGQPKAIVNCQRALQQRVAQSINGAHINAADRLLTLAPLASVVGVRDVITSLLAGASIHLLDAARALPRQILSVISSQAITILFAAPALLRSTVCDARERASPALRLIRVGGETTLWSDIDLLRSWLASHAAIQSIYAATEAPMMQWFVDNACRSENPRIPIGYPLPGNSLAIVDESGGAAARGEVGELIVRSPYVSLGSWGEVRAAADAPGIHATSAQRVFRTGDLVRVRPDGLLERLGRKDRQVKIRGVRVELEGVETAVRRHPLVRDVGVLARTTGEGETILVAYVSVREGAPDALLAELRASMYSAPQPMRPALWYRLNEVPRLPNFKLDLRALRALDASRAAEEIRRAELASGAAAVRSDCIEPTVARIWQEVLQAPAAVPEQDFFQMGGDSLKAIRFVSELEQALGIELPITLINEAPSFGRLCTALKQRRTTRYVPLVLLKGGEGAPPVYFVHGIGGNVAELFLVARSMAYPGAVFGIQARGLRAQETPHLTVKAMAVEYLRAIKARQSEGPYCLCGYSFGGLVAFEIARRLRQSGDTVGFVGLFDTMPNSFVWPLRASLGFVRRRLVRFAVGMISAPVHTWPRAAWRAGARMLTRLHDHLEQRQPGGLPVPALLKSAPASVLKVGVSALLASARYHPGFYAGELTVFIPTSRDPSLPSPQLIWRRHALALSVVPTLGGHLSMFSAANAEAAAASLTRVLTLSASSHAATNTSKPSSNASRRWAFIRMRKGSMTRTGSCIRGTSKMSSDRDAGSLS